MPGEDDRTPSDPNREPVGEVGQRLQDDADRESESPGAAATDGSDVLEGAPEPSEPA